MRAEKVSSAPNTASATNDLPATMTGFIRLCPCPALVGAGVAGPDVDGGTVCRTGVADIEAQSGLDVTDRAVGVDGPLLVGGAVAVPDPCPGPGRGAAWHLQALAHHL